MDSDEKFIFIFCVLIIALVTLFNTEACRRTEAEDKKPFVWIINQSSPRVQVIQHATLGHCYIAGDYQTTWIPIPEEMCSTEGGKK